MMESQSRVASLLPALLAKQPANGILTIWSHLPAKGVNRPFLRKRLPGPAHGRDGLRFD
jgi:hypothetical protein